MQREPIPVAYLASIDAPSRRCGDNSTVHPPAANPCGAVVPLLTALAGQVSWDADGRLVGEGDLTAQSEQAYLNVARALIELGASTDDMTRVTVYVVGMTPESTAMVMAGRRRASDALGVEFQHPGTFVGVTALWDPNYLIEVEATAIID
ncbi:RidA family protein [Subtercola sp. YIM 133946]|uniref:RidA family protein n=1 Tax=Subtercola sp. YIM 133946 TaxID=3118909 RepID=UPI002F94588A